MADIIDPQIIKFTNEYIRPLAEDIRALEINLDAAYDTYTGEIAGLMSGNVDGDLLEDGRGPQGVSRLTKKDITDFLAVANALRTELDAAGVMDSVRKPTVRPYRVRGS